MPLTLLCLLLTIGRVSAPDPGSRASDVAPLDDYAVILTELLGQVVTDEGLVRYNLLRGPLREDFRRVLKTIEDYDASTLTTDAEKHAFWMNAYNVQMLQHILETPEVNDIIEDGYAEAFFQTPYLTAGMALTLDQIEHVILRRQDGPAEITALQVSRLDPRIHVGLNCAAVSCPRLRLRAFTPETVEAELDAAMRDFANSPAHLRIDDGHLVASALLDWFGADFDHGDQPAGDWLLSFMAPSRPDYALLKDVLQGRSSDEIRSLPGVRFEYLWTVNRAP